MAYIYFPAFVAQAAWSDPEFGMFAARILLAAFALVLTASSASAVTFSVSGSNLVGQHLSGYLEADAGLTSITSGNFEVTGLNGAFTVWDYESPLLTISGPSYFRVFLSFPGGPSLGDATENRETQYAEDVASILAAYDPANCNGNLSCENFTPQERADFLARVLFLRDSAFIAEVSAVPIPAALPLFASVLGVAGLLGYRRKRVAALAGA